MSKHSNGPFHVGEGRGTLIVYRPDGYAICDCKTFHGRISQDEAEGNAALIAAAPTMLEQLCEAARLMCYYRPRDRYTDGSTMMGPSETLRNLHATIALAEGRDPGEGVADAEAALAKAEGRS